MMPVGSVFGQPPVERAQAAASEPVPARASATVTASATGTRRPKLSLPRISKIAPRQGTQSRSSQGAERGRPPFSPIQAITLVEVRLRARPFRECERCRDSWEQSWRPCCRTPQSSRRRFPLNLLYDSDGTGSVEVRVTNGSVIHACCVALPWRERSDLIYLSDDKFLNS